MKKTLRKVLPVLALVLVVAVASVGGTLAWLKVSTAPVVNTFTVGDINITLTESENLDLKMVPGKTITKDPKVTVEANSEACWLFVKIEKSSNLGNFITYTVADGWTALTGHEGVYYREVGATGATALNFDVLASNTVTVKDTVTKADMNALTAATYPTLTFTAYAVQKDGITDVATAWGQASTATTTGN